MKRILLLSILSVFVLGNIILFSEYLDVGDDPEKISISNLKEITGSDKYEFIEFSPNGNFIAFHNNKTISSVIFRSDGSVYKKIDDYFVAWTKNENQIIVHEWKGDNSSQNLKLCVLDLISGQKRYLNLYSDLTKINYLDFNIFNNNMYFFVKNSSDFYEYNFDNNKSQKIFSFDFEIEDYYSISIDSFIISKTLKSDPFRYEIYSFNRNNKAIKKIFPASVRSIYDYKLKSSKVFFSFELKSDIYIIDKNGNVISNKIKLFPFKSPRSNERFFSYDLSPNGKLMCATIGVLEEESDEGFVKADLYIFDLEGNSKKLTNTPDNLEIISQWSPSGSKIIFFNYKSNIYYLASMLKKN